jgi:hypothetical protein
VNFAVNKINKFKIKENIMKKVNINAVPDNSIIYIDGIVDFSQITKRIEGAELEADNARKAKYGMIGDSKPHSRLSVSQAVVHCADPANPTIGEQFIAERFYASKKYPDKKALYSGLNKGLQLPDVYVRDESDPTKLIPVTPEKELAAGLKVTLVVRIYPTNLNKGTSLDAVICNEPIRYHSNTASARALSANGYTIAAAAIPETVAAPAVPARAVPDLPAYLTGVAIPAV